jgi:hypothetical protein
MNRFPDAQKEAPMNIESTLAERGARYGKFADHAAICQGIKRAMWSRPGWSRLAADQQQALETIADKIARMLNGDPAYHDNWHDIVGYAKLVADRLAAEQVNAC